MREKEEQGGQSVDIFLAVRRWQICISGNFFGEVHFQPYDWSDLFRTGLSRMRRRNLSEKLRKDLEKKRDLLDAPLMPLGDNRLMSDSFVDSFVATC